MGDTRELVVSRADAEQMSAKQPIHQLQLLTTLWLNLWLPRAQTFHTTLGYMTQAVVLQPGAAIVAKAVAAAAAAISTAAGSRQQCFSLSSMGSQT